MGKGNNQKGNKEAKKPKKEKAKSPFVAEAGNIRSPQVGSKKK